MPSAAGRATTIELDGSYGEGGGALIRAALAMSALTEQPFRIAAVRGGTKHPGLDLEDVLVIQGIASSCAAKVAGGVVGSQSFSFSPTRPVGPMSLDPASDKAVGRGANALVVAGALLPVAARAGAFSEFKLVGETYGPNTLTFDYFRAVTLAAARRMGLWAAVRQPVAGFGREAYGEVELEVEPSALEGVEWIRRGPMKACRASMVTSQLPEAIGARGAAHLKRLAHYSGLPMHVETRDAPGSSPGAVVTAWAEFETGCGGVASVGARGVRVETVAQGAFEALSSFIAGDATVDPHLADQLLLLGVLAEGRTVFTVPRLTQRLLTMIWVVKQFSPIHITVSGSEGKPGGVVIAR